MRVPALAVLALLLPVPAVTSAHAEPATILIALEPQKTSGKRWDVGGGADVVLCSRQGCWRSSGLERPARHLTGKRALSPFAALNLVSKAGACTNKLVCSFRGVELEGSASFLQPIDVDADRHDRLEHAIVAPDRSCVMRKGELACFRGRYTREYSMWVVPEEVAATAGPGRIERALSSGLAEARLAYAEEFLTEEREALPQLVDAFYRLVLGEGLSARCADQFDVLSEAFALSGALPREDREAAGLLVDYLEQAGRMRLLKSISTAPGAFWRLHDAVGHLNQVVSAEKTRQDDGVTGIRLAEDGEGRLELVVGADAFERARSLIDVCEGRDELDLSTIAQPRNG